MKTTFERKPDFRFREYEVKKSVTIPGKRFEELLLVISGFSGISERSKSVQVKGRVDTKLPELVNAYIRDSTVQNRTGLIEDALRFYLGFLTTKKAGDYLLQSLSPVMTGTVQDIGNRIARTDFKLAVEMSKPAHVSAYTHDVDEEALHKLHLKCLDEFKRINSAVTFEDAYKYQKRET